jgi:hypothetical protein
VDYAKGGDKSLTLSMTTRGLPGPHDPDHPRGCPEDEGKPLPIYIMPDIYPNIRRANGRPLLFSISPMNSRDVRNACGVTGMTLATDLGSFVKNNEVPTIDHVHEYPYAATEEGGVGAYLEVVPGIEKGLQGEGGYFGSWLKAKVRNHCKFQVLPILGGTQR